MKKIGTILVALSIAITLGACRRDEQNVTGSYGSGIVTGQVTMASSIANGSPEGVQVTVAGTGITTTLGADGRFAFTSVPDDATLHFTRADGIDAMLNIGHASSVAVELSAAAAASSSGGRRRAVGSLPGAATEVEGTIKTSSADSLVIASHRGEVTVALTPSTVIRKGQTAVAAADLKAGSEVHVRAAMVNKVFTALLVIVQHDSGDDDNARPEAEVSGVVSAVGASSITVAGTTVNTDAHTQIRKQGTTISLGDVHAGDRVEAKGTRVDATTILASTIEVEGEGGGHH